MKNNKTLIAICILLIIIFGLFVLMSKRSEAPTVVQTSETTINSQAPEIPAQITNNNEATSDDIVIDVPTSNQVISSGTLKVSGKARGSWYFEASAPFEIEDSNKNVIETSSIKSQGDWTTTDFVPFAGEITFTVPKGVKNGFVVFKNDNPSGDPAHDKSISIPVTFK